MKIGRDFRRLRFGSAPPSRSGPIYVRSIGGETRVVRDLEPVGFSMTWVCAWCGGFRAMEEATTCPGCGAPRTVDGYEMTMEMAGR